MNKYPAKTSRAEMNKSIQNDNEQNSCGFQLVDLHVFLCSEKFAKNRLFLAKNHFNGDTILPA